MRCARFTFGRRAYRIVLGFYLNAYFFWSVDRDIKGANLLVDSFGVVKLADFGMAKHVSTGSFFTPFLRFSLITPLLHLDILYSDVSLHYATIFYSLILGLLSLDVLVVQLSGHVGNLSLKGSPYWMAPEVTFSNQYVMPRGKSGLSFLILIQFSFYSSCNP